MFICICLIEVEMKIIFFVKVICNYCLKYVYNKKDNIRIFVLNFWKFKNIKNYLMYCYLNFKKNFVLNIWIFYIRDNCILIRLKIWLDYFVLKILG